MRHFGMYKSKWFCRWCGNEYRPDQETERDGFCSGKCKQALHRAYKAYTDYLLGKRGKRGKYKKEALPKKIDRSDRNPGTRRTRNVKKLVAMILVLGAILLFCGCHQDNRKRIKPKLLSDEYRQTQDYKDMIDLIIWHEYVRRYGDVYQKKSRPPNLP